MFFFIFQICGSHQWSQIPVTSKCFLLYFRSVGHISGVIQFALSFFMVSVQIGISGSQWLTESFEEAFQDECHNPFFLSYLSYVILLLLIQIIVSPFILNLGRNQNEGVLYFVATLFLTALWCGWISSYILFDHTWSDMAISGGILGTASILLVTIFIPKTYLLLDSINPSLLPPVPSNFRDKMAISEMHPPRSTVLQFLRVYRNN